MQTVVSKQSVQTTDKNSKIRNTFDLLTDSRWNAHIYTFPINHKYSYQYVYKNTPRYTYIEYTNRLVVVRVYAYMNMRIHGQS